MTFKGKVTDPSGEALTGANVYVSDANGNVLNPPKGATADAKGNYKFDSMTNDYITASFVGMKKIRYAMYKDRLLLMVEVSL